MARKSTRAQRRAARYAARKATAADGRELLVVAWEWLLAELTALKRADPVKADAACRNLAGQVEQIASSTAGEVERAHLPLR